MIKDDQTARPCTRRRTKTLDAAAGFVQVVYSAETTPLAHVMIRARIFIWIYYAI